jgi:hypothetical protein
MKVTVYIEKNDFDEFFKWMNRIGLGIYSTPTVKFSHREEDIQDPLKVTLDSREYTLIKDVKKDIEDIQKMHGPLEIDFSPVSTASHLLIIQDVLREAERKDLLAEVVFSAIQVALQLPDISPTEAIVMAEHEWLGIRGDSEYE